MRQGIAGQRQSSAHTVHQPYCRIRNVVEAGIAKRQTAAAYLKGLVAAVVLEEVKAGREKLFINPRLMRLLPAEDSGNPAFRE